MYVDPLFSVFLSLQPWQDIDYDKVDWDESLDVDDDREAQDRWFDEDSDGE